MDQKLVMDAETSAMILEEWRRLKSAQIYRASTVKPFSVQTITLDLTTAKLATDPFKIGFPFKSVYISSATDTTVNVNMQVNTRDSYQSSIPLYLNDSWVSDEELSEAYLYWSAQSAKSITLTLFVDSEFRSGKQISVTGGGVTIVDGSSISGPTRVTLAATTATIIAPALSNRKKCTIQNKSGADLYIGGSTIGAVGGATEGIKIPNDGIIYWQNTGALYGWSVPGGNIHYLEET